MKFSLNSSIPLLVFLLHATKESNIIYHDDYEPRVFDSIPSDCYDCLSYREIIFTQLIDVSARAFANFQLGPRDTFLKLNGHEKLILHPYAFQSLLVQKPNQTLTIAFAAPNSWLNITENTFHGLELSPFSTLRIVIKSFYGCTFHSKSLSGIRMSRASRLILDISFVTEVFFENQMFEENDLHSSVEFLIASTDSIRFDPYSFAHLNIRSSEMLSFHFEFISHIHFKSHAFRALHLQTSSSVRFYSIYLNRLTIDSYAFENMLLHSHAVFNLTMRSLGTSLCFKGYSFSNLQTIEGSVDALVFFHFHSLRGLSFFPKTFANLSLNSPHNRLQILSHNLLTDPNPIINLAMDTFTARTSGSIVLNFSEVTVVRVERNSLNTNLVTHQLFFKDISLVDLSALNPSLIQSKFDVYFDNIQYVKWYKPFNSQQPWIAYHFNSLSNTSCLIYSAPRSVSWLFPRTNSTPCHCPVLYAYKHGQLDGQTIPCLHAMSGRELSKQMNECHFDRTESTCRSLVQSLTSFNQSSENVSKNFNLFELDHFLIRQLYDRNYLSCSFNYSLVSSSSTIVRSRLFNHFGFVLGIILAVFFLLLVLVIGLLNGLQYKMREYDETWTWRRNMSWSTLRRTFSQTSLRRSRRDLCHGLTSKSDNQLDRPRYDQQDSEDQEFVYDFKPSQSIQEDLKGRYRTEL